MGRPQVVSGRDRLEEARVRIQEAGSVAILTGAGISAESGVPTFRGKEGLWRSFPPEELATPEAFRRDPALVWEWYTWRRGLVARCAPNEGHRSIARFALSHPERSVLVTQNVDGLHQRAAEEAAGTGDPGPARPLELHGSLFRDRCTGCGRRTAAPPGIEGPAAGPAAPDVRSESSAPAPRRPDPPRCSQCGSLLRPDVVWFGEPLDEGVLDRAFSAAARCDVCIVVGTSGLVHPAASLPRAALAADRAVIEVNPEPTPLSMHATVVLAGTAGALLPSLLGP